MTNISSNKNEQETKLLIRVTRQGTFDYFKLLFSFMQIFILAF